MLLFSITLFIDPRLLNITWNGSHFTLKLKPNKQIIKIDLGILMKKFLDPSVSVAIVKVYSKSRSVLADR